MIKLLIFGFCVRTVEGYDREMMHMLREQYEAQSGDRPEITADRLAEFRDEDRLVPYEPQAEEEGLLPEKLGDDKIKCAKCIRGVIDYIMKLEMGKFEDWCAKEYGKKCPIKERLCALLKKSPKTVAGMVFAWVTPFRDGLFWCLGHGECKPEDALQDQEGSEWSIMPFKVDTTKLVASMDFDDVDFNEEGAFDMLQEQEFAVEEGFLEQEIAEMGDHDLGRKKVCKKCMKKVMCCVMKKVVTKVMEWCKHGDGQKPKLHWICQFMKAHKKFTFGWLLATVQPWKFAYGYCLPHDKPEEGNGQPKQMGLWKMLWMKHKMKAQAEGKPWHNEGYLRARPEDLPGMEEEQEQEAPQQRRMLLA